MKIAPFQLERYFAKYEFSARYLLSCSDCEALRLSELLEIADEESRQLWRDLKLGYTETWGHPVLRECAAGIYERMEAENILAAAPEECIFLSMHAILSPGDHVICTFPGYQSLHEIARSIGCEMSFWKADENKGWSFDLDILNSMIRKNTKLIVINFPHNPTGFVPARDKFEEIVKIAKQRGIFLFSDEMYRFLESGNVETLPSACDLYEKAVSLFGLSKTFGLPGLRIGWLACRNSELLQKVSRLKDYTTICNGAPSEILAVIALRRREEIVGAQNVLVRKNLSFLVRFFDERKGLFSWNRPLGGPVTFPRISFTDSAQAFCDKLVKETGIMLAPSTLFDFGDNHVRIGFGRAGFQDALARFAEYVDESCA